MGVLPTTFLHQVVTNSLVCDVTPEMQFDIEDEVPVQEASWTDALAGAYHQVVGTAKSTVNRVVRRFADLPQGVSVEREPALIRGVHVQSSPAVPAIIGLPSLIMDEYGGVWLHLWDSRVF